MSDRLTHHAALLDTLYEQCRRYAEADTQHDDRARQELLTLVDSTRKAVSTQGDYAALGQSLIALIVSHHPSLTPAVHRDLFWFFGGDCLHFMSDEEIALYQRLDEQLHERLEAKGDVDYSALRTQVFGYH